MSRVRPPSNPDPGHIFYETGGLANSTTYTDVTGKAQRSLTISPSEKTLVMICAGQSLVTDFITDTFTPVNASKLDNYAWYNGTLWEATTPLVGTSWHTNIASSVNFNHKIADGIISNGKFNRVIIVPVAMAGTSMNQWVNDFTTEPTGYYRMIQTAVKKLAVQGITASTPGVKFLIKWNQGESDTQAGTSQDSYTNDFNKFVSLCSLDLTSVKFMIAKETYILGLTSPAIQAAQLALVNNVNIFAGEDMDSIPSTGRFDNTHLNAAGGNLATTKGIAAITAITF